MVPLLMVLIVLYISSLQSHTLAACKALQYVQRCLMLVPAAVASNSYANCSDYHRLGGEIQPCTPKQQLSMKDFQKDTANDKLASLMRMRSSSSGLLGLFLLLGAVGFPDSLGGWLLLPRNMESVIDAKGVPKDTRLA